MTTTYVPNANWETVITTNTVAMVAFFMVAAYILWQSSQKQAQKRSTCGEIPPNGQHHLCEEGANDESDARHEHGAVTSISRKSWNGDIQGSM
jgi:hypothetical protein